MAPDLETIDRDAIDRDAIDRGALVEPNPPIRFFAGPWHVCRNVIAHRSLVANFVRRDLRLKYRNSALGYLWSLVEPLLLSGVYYILFVLIAGNPEPHYHLYVVVGVVTWAFFARGLNAAVSSLTANESMIKQVYFPRELFSVTAVASQLAIAALSLLVAVPFLIGYGIGPTWGLLWVPVGLAMAALLTVGVGLSMACLNVVNRDVQHLFRFLTRAGLFLSPVLWTVERAAASKSGAIDYLLLNPMAAPLTLIRNGIVGLPLPLEWHHIAYAGGFAVASFAVGACVFRRFEATVVKKI